MQKNQIGYFSGWSIADKVPRRELSISEALKMHTAGKPYTVVVSLDGKPICYLIISKYSISVGFLDEYLRVYVDYVFDVIDAGRIFLAQALTRQFEGISDNVESAMMFLFSPDGQISVNEMATAFSITNTENISADVSGNYEKFPPFGDYDAVIVKERHLFKK